MKLSVILAKTRNDVIGSTWSQDGTSHDEVMSCPIDKEHFKLTTQYTPCGGHNLLLVGRKTWETLPPIMRKCPRRKYIILTRQSDYKSDSDKNIVLNSFDVALTYIMKSRETYHKCFVIGRCRNLSLGFRFWIC